MPRTTPTNPNPTILPPLSPPPYVRRTMSSGRRRPSRLQAPPSSPRSGPPVPSPLPYPFSTSPSTSPTPFTSPSQSSSSSSPSPSPSPTPLRTRPLLHKEYRACRRNPPRNPNCGEVTGGTAAECMAVLCCCPFCIMDIVVLTTLRLPAGLCKKAVRKRRIRKKIKARRKEDSDGEDEEEEEEEEDFVYVRRVGRGKEAVLAEVQLPPTKEMERLEEEMWTMFDGAGFWRSHSRKEQPGEVSLPLGYF